MCRTECFCKKRLAWIGPWQYQAFAGQLQDYDAVPDAKLIGLRVTAQPLPYLELGASRAMQWGGGDRSESLSTLWNAIKGNDNFDNSDDDNEGVTHMVQTQSNSNNKNGDYIVIHKETVVNYFFMSVLGISFSDLNILLSSFIFSFCKYFCELWLA